MNWLERARIEIQENATERAANSAERTLTAAMAARARRLFGSNGSNGSAPTQKISEIEAAREASRAEALIDEAWRAGIIFRLVDPRPREIAERRPFSLRIRYPKGTPRSLIYMLRAARAEIYTAFTPADPVQNVQNNPERTKPALAAERSVARSF